MLLSTVVVQQMPQLYLPKHPAIDDAALVEFGEALRGAPEDGVEDGFGVRLENRVQLVRERVEEVFERVDAVEVCHDVQLNFDGEGEEAVAVGCHGCCCFGLWFMFGGK